MLVKFVRNACDQQKAQDCFSIATALEPMKRDKIGKNELVGESTKLNVAITTLPKGITVSIDGVRHRSTYPTVCFSLLSRVCTPKCCASDTTGSPARSI